MFKSLINTRMGLGLKLGLVAVVCAGAIFAVAAYCQYREAMALALTEAETRAASAAQAALMHVESVMNNIESLTRYLAIEMEEDIRPPVPKLMERLRICVAANTNMFGADIAYEPYAYDPSKYHSDFYVWRGASGVTNAADGDENYRYHLMDWYLLPKELKRGCWSDPYYDEGGGNAVMCSYAEPFYARVDGQCVFKGVVDADVELGWLGRIVGSIALSENGYTFIIGRNGSFVAHPNREYILRESIFSLAEEQGDVSLRRIGKDMIGGGSAMKPMQSAYLGRPAWIYYAPMRSLGWSFGVVIPEDELFAGARAVTRRELFGNAVVLAALFAVILLAVTRMTKPLKTLSEKSDEMAGGNLDVTLPPGGSHDEIGDLTRSFERMRTSLKDYIENLRVTTAAREKIESELGVARRIQLSFVPRVFPPFPERGEFDVYAILDPAREVGGDLFNYCLTGKDRLHFCIGDVSDKGVPAALLMAVTQTLTRTLAQQGPSSPADILGGVNRELCQENDQVMFVTMLCASLDVQTGEVVVSNAGHNPPLIIRSGGAVEWVKLPPGLVLAVDPASRYTTSAVHLMPGDILLLYTDGVTEAMNAQRTLYSEQRLEETARVCAGTSPQATVDLVLKSVKAHAGGEAQSDDITIMAVKFNGAKTS